MSDAAISLDDLPQEAAPGHPKFNHVAMSVPADLLDEAGRARIARFYHEVFGWDELTMMAEDRTRMVLMAYEYGQFVYLIADDRPMTAPRMDHFGMSVATEAEFDGFLAAAKRVAADDAEVDLIDKTVEDFGIGKIHSFYVGYLLPMMVEVQWFEQVAQDAT